MQSSSFGPREYASYTSDFKDPVAFIAQLAGAINDEASAIRLYEDLEGMAPSEYRDFVTHAKNDEMIHLQLFRKLYRKLTGNDSVVQTEVPKFPTYKAGVEIAFRRELEAAELYRDMYLSTRNPKIRDTLFKTMTDEMEHAQRFSFLFSL